MATIDELRDEMHQRGAARNQEGMRIRAAVANPPPVDPRLQAPQGDVRQAVAAREPVTDPRLQPRPAADPRAGVAANADAVQQRMAQVRPAAIDAPPARPGVQMPPNAGPQPRVAPQPLEINRDPRAAFARPAAAPAAPPAMPPAPPPRNVAPPVAAAAPAAAAAIDSAPTTWAGRARAAMAPITRAAGRALAPLGVAYEGLETAHDVNTPGMTDMDKAGRVAEGGARLAGAGAGALAGAAFGPVGSIVGGIGGYFSPDLVNKAYNFGQGVVRYAQGGDFQMGDNQLASGRAAELRANARPAPAAPRPAARPAIDAPRPSGDNRAVWDAIERDARATGVIDNFAYDIGGQRGRIGGGGQQAAGNGGDYAPAAPRPRAAPAAAPAQPAAIDQGPRPAAPFGLIPPENPAGLTADDLARPRTPVYAVPGADGSVQYVSAEFGAGEGQPMQADPNAALPRPRLSPMRAEGDVQPVYTNAANVNAFQGSGVEVVNPGERYAANVRRAVPEDVSDARAPEYGAKRQGYAIDRANPYDAEVRTTTAVENVKGEQDVRKQRVANEGTTGAASINAGERRYATDATTANEKAKREEDQYGHAPGGQFIGPDGMTVLQKPAVVYNKKTGDPKADKAKPVVSEADAHTEAKAAIAKGANKDVVNKRLKEAGFKPL